MTDPFTPATPQPAAADLRALPDPADPRATAEAIMFEIRRVIVGQDEMLERVLVGLLAGGHLLLEGVPGLAKTLTIKTLADVLGGSFKRIQFTPDLMPSDLVGTRIYRPDQAGFEVEPGPVFANFLLADEINRAPAKVQSALLEVMQEHQVTIGHETFKVPTPFLVLATENPIEAEGTYPLPEAQVDRFMLKILLDYPNAADEAQIVLRSLADAAEPREILDAAGLLRLQHAVDRRLRRPAAHQLRGRARRGHPQAHLLGRARARDLRVLRRQPARLDQPHPRRPGDGPAPRPPLRPAVRHRRARPRRPSPSPGHELLGAGRGRHRRTPSSIASSRSSRPRASRWRWSRPHDRRRRPRAGRWADAHRGPTRARPHRGPARPSARAHLDRTRRRPDERRPPRSRSRDGLELDRIRPYEPGDDVRKIDWNATARTMTPHVREDVPERQLTAWLLLDHSPSMHFGTADRRKADVAEGAALVVGRFAARRGNRLGIVTFGAARNQRHAAGRRSSRACSACSGRSQTEPAEEGHGPTSPARALCARRRDPHDPRGRRRRVRLPRAA